MSRTYAFRRLLSLLIMVCAITTGSFAQLPGDSLHIDSLVVVDSQLVKPSFTADSVLEFISKNRQRSSVYITDNDSILVKLNESTPMPLAQTTNMMIAVEFVKQAEKGLIDEDDYVAISDINYYNLPDSANDVQGTWLKYEKEHKHIKMGDSIQLVNVARGMMMFQSNANAEFLLDLLGFDNVKDNAEIFGLKQHSAIFPAAASFFMYQNPKKANPKSIFKYVRHLTEEQYCKSIYDFHMEMKADSNYKNKYKQQDFTLRLQKLWSDRLVSSNTREYVLLCRMLNKRKYFSRYGFGLVAEILEQYMENPDNQGWLKHAAANGGSTPWILTRTLYGTTRENRRIEMAYFLEELEPGDNIKLQSGINDFEFKMLSSPEFREKVRITLMTEEVIEPVIMTTMNGKQ